MRFIWTHSTNWLRQDICPGLVFVVETYVLGKFKQADLVLKTKQPTADSGKGGLVNVSKLPVRTLNETINQSMSTWRKIT